MCVCVCKCVCVCVCVEWGVWRDGERCRLDHPHHRPPPCGWARRGRERGHACKEQEGTGRKRGWAWLEDGMPIFFLNFGFKDRVLSKNFACEVRFLFKQFGSKEDFFVKHFGFKAKLLFKYFGCKARLCKNVGLEA